MMTEVQLYAQRPGGRLGMAGSIVVGVYEGSSDLGLLEDLDRAQTEAVARYGRFTSLSIVSAKRLEMSPPDYRSRGAELATKFQPSTIGTAIVILTTGAAAVAAYGFLAAYALIVKQQVPQQIFRQLGPAVTWVQGLPGQFDDVKQLKELEPALAAFVASKA